MKKQIAVTLLLFVYTFGMAQANKPDAGNFGIRSGIYFNPNYGTGITFSRYLKNNLEAGLGIMFTFNGSKHTTLDTFTINTKAGLESAKSENTNRSFNYNINLTPYVAYHFPIKSNFDVYAGGSITLAAGNTPLAETTTHRTADNYEYKSVTKIFYPFTFGVGGGFLLGADYYFHKNIAAGLSGSVGFASNFQYGKQITKRDIVNSGSANQESYNATTENSVTIKNADGNIAFRGGVGFNLTFYFARTEKKKEAAK